MNAKETLLAVAIKNDGDWAKSLNDIKSKVEMVGASEWVSSYEGEYKTILDEDYPQGAKNACRPPLVIFYEGAYGLVESALDKIAVIGMETDERALKTILGGKNDFIPVIQSRSKLAKAVVGLGLPTILVCPNGLDKVDDELKAKALGNGGLLLTEYPNGVEASAEKSVVTQRLLPMFADCALSLTSTRHSPSMFALTAFLQMGKDVMACPKSVGEPYDENNALIRDGAIPVWNSFELEDALSGIKPKR